MECNAASVSGWRVECEAVGRRACEMGTERQAEAPGMDRMEDAVKLVQGRIWRTSHQKCLV